MFNTPILDVAIGLVFVFLLYSLLTTSINEAVATGLALRARMLRKSIAEVMLSNTSDDSKLTSFWKGVWDYITTLVYLVIDKKPKKGNKKNIGDQFYDHPIIKNYGSNRIFKYPSYLSAANFSTILTDVLKEDFNNKLAEIAVLHTGDNTSLQDAAIKLTNGSDLSKIKALFDFYSRYYARNPGRKIYDSDPLVPRGLDKEIYCILHLHLKNSLYNFNDFIRRVEGWYNDGQDRVTGWYKRQSQLISFIIGLMIASMFNVDTIEITGKLSKDKTARDQVVQMAIKATDDYKNDPRVQLALKDKDSANAAKKLDLLSERYQKNMDDAKKLIDSDIKNSNQLLAIGWDQYGQNDSNFIRSIGWHFSCVRFPFLYVPVVDPLFNSLAIAAHNHDAQLKTKYPVIYGKPGDSLSTDKKMLDSLRTAGDTLVGTGYLDTFYRQKMKQHPLQLKLAYVFSLIGPKKILGFLLTAFAISLGAPFWFDLLNKLVKLRAAGKKEDSTTGGNPSAVSPSSPLTVNVTTANPNPSEEAVG
jgi:hypothetical protein